MFPDRKVDHRPHRGEDTLLGTRDWQDFPAGTLIWNAAGEPHATRVYDEPFISVFVWLENVNSPCNVIHCDDWPKIEKDLAE